MARGSDIFAEAIVVNLLDGTILPRHMPGFPIEKYLPLLLDGGLTAFVTTVAAHHQDDFPAAVARLIHWRRLLDANPSALRLILKPNDLVAAKQSNQVGVIFGFQDPKPIGEDLLFLEALYHLGLRVLQLTYQRRTLAGDGCGESANGGLSAFGRLLVRECNRLGVLVDLAHAGYRTTLDAIATSEAPILISHTGSYALCPHVRNIQDDQLRAIAENGGVVGVYAISQFIRQDGGKRGADITDVVDHIEYIANLVGVDYVGIGLDIGANIKANEEQARERAWRTLGEEFPELFAPQYDFQKRYVRGLETPAGVPLLTKALLERGFTADEVVKILGRNFLRVFREATQYASHS